MTDDEACSIMDISVSRRVNPPIGAGRKIDTPRHHTKVLARSEATDDHGLGRSKSKAFLDRGADT